MLIKCCVVLLLQSKVKNRLWVLNECVERVPEDYEAAKQLLRYGLHGTDAKVVETVGRGKGPLPFIIKAKDGEFEEDEERKKKLRELEESLKFTRYYSNCCKTKIYNVQQNHDFFNLQGKSIFVRKIWEFDISEVKIAVIN